MSEERSRELKSKWRTWKSSHEQEMEAQTFAIETDDLEKQRKYSVLDLTEKDIRLLRAMKIEAP
jgi:hypothetical protein